MHGEFLIDCRLIVCILCTAWLEDSKIYQGMHLSPSICCGDQLKNISTEQVFKHLRNGLSHMITEASLCVGER
jgi:hypothetical protein